MFDHGIIKPVVERRKSRRFSVAGMVYYSDPADGLSDYGFDTPHMGIANDMSVDGAGIFTKHSFSEGEDVRVSFEGLGKLTITGTVRWCRRCSSQLYRVGIDIPSLH